ncbi:MAG: SDR family NAD(P)-dependent oxidoreductase [Dorea sp.]|nr:SDR family NAD(P)-dependent oxidoreductase [Dorea sp.]
MKLFLPLMLERKQGQILNIGSTGSYISCPYDAVYAATKSYILSVSKGDTLLFKLFVMSPERVLI